MTDVSADVLQAFVQQISRTASGIVDVTAAAEKRARFGTTFAAEDVRQAQVDAVSRVAALHAAHAAKPLGSPHEWMALLLRTNELLVGDSNGMLLRTFAPDLPLPYIAPALVPRYTAALARHLAARRRQMHVVELAATTVWAVDLRGHLFADGCARTALSVCAFVLARGGAPLPVFGSREEYYGSAYGPDGRLSAQRWRAYFRDRVAERMRA